MEDQPSAEKPPRRYRIIGDADLRKELEAQRFAEAVKRPPDHLEEIARRSIKYLGWSGGQTIPPNVPTQGKPRTPTAGRKGAAPSEDSRRAKPPQAIHATRKHGPSANMKRHGEIAKIVAKYGPEWQDEDNLVEIGKQLDVAKITIPPTWKSRKAFGQKPRSWRRAAELDDFRPLMIKYLNYSLSMVKRPLSPNRT